MYLKLPKLRIIFVLFFMTLVFRRPILRQFLKTKSLASRWSTPVVPPLVHFILISQYFAIQDWKQACNMELIHIPGIINPANCLTKPVAWVLHSNHTHLLMGHYRANFPMASFCLSRLILFLCFYFFVIRYVSDQGGFQPSNSVTVCPSSVHVSPSTVHLQLLLPARTGWLVTLDWLIAEANASK